MNKPLATLLILAALFAGSSLHSRVSAQRSDVNLNLSPPITHIVIQPGKKATAAITIENQGEYDLSVTPTFVDFGSDNATGQPVLSDSMSFPYIFLQNENIAIDAPFTLNKASSTQLLFELNMPETSLEKEYHFTLLFKATPIQSEQPTLNSSTSISANISSNFIVTVSRSAQDRGVLEMASFEGPLFLDSLSSVQAKVFVKNVGPNTTVAMGEFKIIDVFGKIVYQNELLSQNILPNSIRQLFGSEQVIKDGQDYRVKKDFFWKPFFLLGPYKLVFTFHAPGQENQTYTHTVFALPVSIMIFCVVVYILYLVYSKTNLFLVDRKQERKQTSNEENG